jgi:class 3 adenylate cyclase
MSDNPHLNLNHQELKRVDEFRQSRKTAVLTILFTDIVGFTELIEIAGDNKSQEIKQFHDELFIDIVTRDGAGEIVKQIGDSFLAIFSEPSTAVERSLEFQSGLSNIKDQITLGHYTLKVRMGLHMGQVSLEDSLKADIFGGHVNKTARIMSIAHGGQILTSEVVKDNAFSWLKDKGVDVKYYGKAKLKGFSDTTSIYEFFQIDTKPIGIPKIIKNNKIKLYSSLLFLLFIVMAIFLQIKNIYNDPNINKTNYLLYFTSTDKSIDFEYSINQSLREKKPNYPWGKQGVYKPISDSLLNNIRDEASSRLFSEYFRTDLNIEISEERNNLHSVLSNLDYNWEKLLKDLDSLKESSKYEQIILVLFFRLDNKTHLRLLGNNDFGMLGSYNESSEMQDQITESIINSIKDKYYGGHFIGLVSKLTENTAVIINYSDIEISNYTQLNSCPSYDFNNGELEEYLLDLKDAITYYKTNNNDKDLELLSEFEKEYVSKSKGIAGMETLLIDCRFNLDIDIICHHSLLC